MLQVGGISVNSTYDFRLVALSLVIAILASYTALDLAGRVTVAQGRARQMWLIGGAIAMGMGIWSMHFVAMLAFNLPMPMSYNVPIVILSMLPAIIASIGALFLASSPVLSIRQLLIGGVLMGIGIASMHYIGMAAMQMKASISYNPLLFALSVAIAIGASIVALWIAFKLRTQTDVTGRWPRFLSALIMGTAIAGMHYTGMAAATFMSQSATASTVMPQAVNASLTWLAVAIGIATLVILTLTLLTSFVDQRMSTQAQLLAQQDTEAKRSQLFTTVTLRIRESLTIEQILKTVVKEVRDSLETERLVIYRFDSDWKGTVVAESVTPGWTQTINLEIDDPCFSKHHAKQYEQGRVRVINNIYHSDLADCHIKMLEKFEVKANMVAPILKDNGQLLGLMIAHHCSQPRTWQQHEVDLFRQLAIQVGIALEQASFLYELKQTQEVLRLRDRAIAATSNGIVITDSKQADDPIVFCNPAFEKITGYSTPEVLGRNCRFLQGPDTDSATVLAIRNAVREQLECQVVILNYRKDGTPFWNELTISPVRDANGQLTHLIGVQTDITQRQQAQAELRRSKETLQRQLVELIGDVEEASRGDLTVRADVTEGEIGTVADFFNAIIENLRQIVIRVKDTAVQVRASLGDNEGAMRSLADDALKQAQEITHTLDSVERMTLSIQAVATSANQAASVARNAYTTAEVGRVAMEHTVQSILSLQDTVAETAKKVKRLGESSQQISKVVSIINQIALQTNLLSINAGIEAARAGEDSRGFAVVAEEIGQLAAQSSQATQEIAQIVENIQLDTSAVVKAMELGTDQVVEGTHLVANAKLSLEKILANSRQIDELVQSISIATVSQAQTSQAVAILMQEIATVSERTADASGQVSSSLQQTVDVAQQLQASVGVFKTGTQT